jgi:membrane protease YdiL (CAAX protease family)
LYNSEEENTFYQKTSEELSADDLTGSWEQKGKSITAAAITGLFIIGAVYFNVQSILVTFLTIVYRSIYNIVLPQDLIEMIDTVVSELKAPLLLSAIITQYFFMMGLSLWLVKKWHTHKIKKYIRIKSCAVKEILLAVFITVTALPLCYYISNLLMDTLDIPYKIRELGAEFFTANSLPEFFVLIFAIAITPAICEEIFFRGYFQRTLERTVGWKSVLWTGFLFGLFHFQPLSLIVLSILGLLFSFFYYRSKSILPSSFSHFTNNFIALFLLYSQSQSIEIGIPSDGNLPAAIIIISTLLFLVLLWTYFKTTSKQFDLNKIPEWK